MGYIEDRIRLIETVPDDFVEAVEALRPGLVRELVKIIASLDSKGGRLVYSEANLLQIESIIEAMGGYLFSPEAQYLQALTTFIEAQGVSAALTNEALGVISNPLYDALLSQSQFNTIKLFDKVAIETNIGNRIRSAITSAISGEASVAQTISNLQDYVGGSEVGLPALTRYVKAQALTAYGMADANYVTTVGKAEGIERWLYLGGLVEDSRPFCVARAGKEFTTEEVLAWPAEEGYQWDGMINPTDESNIFSNRGGWNCSHILSPVL